MMHLRGRMLTIGALALAPILALQKPACAADPIQVGGRMTCTTAEQHAIPVEGDPGHVLVVQKVTCIGSASGHSAAFDGGRQTWVEADDLVKGSGPIHGYELARYKDGSTGVTSYVGAQVITMVDGKPEWRALGTWERESRHWQSDGCSAQGHMDGKTDLRKRICHGLGRHARRGQQKVSLRARSPFK